METARPRAGAMKASRDSLKRYIVTFGRSKVRHGGDTIANTRGRVRSPEFRDVTVTSALPKKSVELLAAGSIIVSCHCSRIVTTTQQSINSQYEYSCQSEQNTLGKRRFHADRRYDARKRRGARPETRNHERNEGAGSRVW